MSKGQSKTNQILIVFNVILLVLVAILFVKIHYMQQQINGAFLSIQNSQQGVSSLEMDLRNRGIIKGSLLRDAEKKPYSLEQMNEFNEWVSNHQ